MNASALSAKDITDLEFALRLRADLVALSRYDSKLWIRDLMEGAAYLPE
jgi:pyruvate kinase